MEHPSDITSAEQPRCCWQCGYNLSGLPTPRCPECGREFDPGDPWSYALGRAPYAFERPFLAEPPRSIWRLTVLGAVTLLLGDSVPGGYLLLKAVGLFAWFVAGVRWAPRGLVLGLYFLRTRSHACAVRLRPLAASAAVVLASAALLKADATMRIAFLVSRPGLEWLVEQPPGTTLFVGAFVASRTSEPGTVRVWLAGDSGWAGFRFATQRPADEYEITYRRIAPNWYRWRQDF